LVGLLKVASRSVPGSVHDYEDRILVDEKLGLFAVADGVTLSSQGTGGAAAELALSLLREVFSGDIVSAISKVHGTLAERKQEDRAIGETTLTAVAVRGEGSLQAGNVGDSPAYLIRGVTIQSLIQEDRNAFGWITQVIGYPEAVNVHSIRLRLEDGDTVIVASDGVGHVLHAPLVNQLVDKPEVSQVADAIIKEARARVAGYDDDKSVIVLRVAR
jgi:serine/threonine protein phosphatase PrpC